MTHYITEQVGCPPVRGYCPWCGAKSLFLGKGGYVTCSVIGCKNPGFANDLLSDRRLHRIVQGISREMTPMVRERDVSVVSLPCLCCGELRDFPLDSNEANGVFNVFCNGECEDRYAARL